MYNWVPNCLHYWGIVVYSVLVWLKIRLKWKTMFSEWSIVLKYTIKLELTINPLNAELNPICHLLALLGTHRILHVSGVRVE